MEAPMKEESMQEQMDHKDGMRELAKREEDFHTRPFPEAEAPPIDPFSPAVMRGLWLGALIGGIVGAIFGYLLQQNLLVVPGWEMLYSMGPFTFVVFWVFMGIALGVMLIGVGYLLTAPTAGGEESQ